MSRTDKDAPYWVRATFYEPVHAYSCPDCQPVRRWSPGQRYPLRPCTLPPEPVRQSWNLSWRTRGVAGCRWEMDWSGDAWARDINADRPRGRIDRRVSYWGPDRSNSRDACRQAVKEFNSTGDVDVIPATRQHRHASWKGWW